MRASMRQMSVVGVFAVTLVVVLGGTALAQSSNSEVGTWKLNLAKSKGSSLKSGTVKIEAAGAGIKTIVDGVDANGTARHYEFTANYDGKDNPISGNSPDGDMVALTRINATTTKAVNKKSGKMTTTATFVVSSDAKMRTNTATGTNALGRTVNRVTVWDKQ